MGTGTYTLRMDEDFKRGFSAVCEELGDDIPTVVTRLGETLIHKRRVPFTVSADLLYLPANRAHLNRSIARLEAGKRRGREPLAE